VNASEQVLHEPASVVEALNADTKLGLLEGFVNMTMLSARPYTVSTASQ